MPFSRSCNTWIKYGEQYLSQVAQNLVCLYAYVIYSFSSGLSTVFILIVRSKISYFFNWDALVAILALPCSEI